jgi:hypothetical protein
MFDQSEVSGTIDLAELFSFPSVVLVGDPLSGILEVAHHMKKQNPAIDLQVFYTHDEHSVFERAELIIEIVQNCNGTRVERDMIIQKWKDHDIPPTAIPFIIKHSGIEPDTTRRVV